MCFEVLVVSGMFDVLVIVAYARLAILVYVRSAILEYERLVIIVFPDAGGPLSCWTQWGN